MGFVVILTIQAYASVLNRTRAAGAADMWLAVGAAAAVALTLLWNPARTYVRSPDLALLLRLESRMSEYFRGAWVWGGATSAALTLAALLLYWPLYDAANLGSAASYAASAAALLTLKALLYAGAWRERRFRFAGVRRAFAAVKAAAAVATAYALLRGPLDAADAGLALLWVAYAVALRAPRAHLVPWEHLLELERRTRTLHERWFGFFVDLPFRGETYRPRRYWNALLRLLRYDAANAFRYMYWRTFLRSSMSALALRMIALEAALVWIFPNPWTAVALYVVFCWLIGLQLRGIQAPPTEPLLSAMSPQPPSRRSESQRAVRRTAHGIAALLLAAMPAVAVSLPLAAACAAGGAAAAFLFARTRPERV
jgi:ABC-2 type transport system permease protein